jgi:hypothetical protein
MGNVYKILVREPEGKRLVERLRHMWEDNIKMDLEEMGWRMWTGMIQFQIGIGGGHL